MRRLIIYTIIIGIVSTLSFSNREPFMPVRLIIILNNVCDSTRWRFDETNELRTYVNQRALSEIKDTSGLVK